MENRKSGSMATYQNRTQVNDRILSAPMQSAQLMKLFDDEVRYIYWVGKTLSNAIPKLLKNATSPELVEALVSHLVETEHQVTRIEKVFALMGKKPIPKRCLAMEGLMKEVGEMMEACDPGAMCDAGIISAELKIQHYEIAAYETLRQFADTLGLEDAVDLFEITLEEQKDSVEKFAGVSVSAIEVYDADDNDEEGLPGHHRNYELQYA